MCDIMLKGICGVTQKVTSSNAVQTLSDLLTYGDYSPIGLFITSETYPIRFAFRVDPSATSGHVLPKDKTLFLEDGFAARNFRFISDTAGEHGVLYITPIYNPGKYVAS